MTSMNIFTNGTTADANEVNFNFTHRGASGTSVLLFTPTSATTTKVWIVAKGNITTSDAETITLASSVDGTLDTVVADDQATSPIIVPFTLTYFGTLSATAHTLTVTGTSTLGNQKITLLEFLA